MSAPAGARAWEGQRAGEQGGGACGWRARAWRRGARLRAVMRKRRRGREKGLPTHQGVERALLGVGARERAAVGGEDHLAAGVVWGIVACGGRTGGGSPPEGRARRGQGCAASDAGSPLANLRRNKKNFIPRQSTPPSVGVLTKVTALPLGPRKTLCRRPPACASTQCVCCGRLAAKVARPRGRSL